MWRIFLFDGGRYSRRPQVDRTGGAGGFPFSNLGERKDPSASPTLSLMIDIAVAVAAPEAICREDPENPGFLPSWLPGPVFFLIVVHWDNGFPGDLDHDPDHGIQNGICEEPAVIIKLIVSSPPRICCINGDGRLRH